MAHPTESTQSTAPDEPSQSAQPDRPSTAGPPRPVMIGEGVGWVARWSGRWLLIAGAAVVLGLLVGQIWVILFPIALALLLTSVLEPAARLLERRLKFPPAVAAASVLLGGLASLIGIGFAIAPSVSGQVDDIIEQASGGLQQVQDWIQAQEFVSRDQIDAGIQAIQDRLGDSGQAIASGVITGFGTAASLSVTTVITLILTFLFLKDGRHFRPLVARVAGDPVGPHLSEVLLRSWRTIGGYLRTQAIVSAVDAVLIGIALLIVGVPLAIPLAILTFVGGFVPIVGAFVVGGLAVLVALVSQGPTEALIILAVIVAVQQFEGNVLSPVLQSKSMKLHAAVVLLSVTLGSTLFGIAGAFLAVPVAAVVAVVLRYFDELLEARAAGGDSDAADVAADDETTTARGDD